MGERIETIVVSATELGLHLDLSERQVGELARAGVVERVGRGRYELHASRRRYIHYLWRSERRTRAPLCW